MAKRPPPAATVRRANRHAWALEPLEDHPTFLARPMFGCLAAYFNGLLVLVLADDATDPWHGLLVPVERDSHPRLCAEFPHLEPHPVLPKWLYLSEAAPSFERDAAQLVERIRRLDPLIGVLPGRDRPAKKRRASPRESGP